MSDPVVMEVPPRLVELRERMLGAADAVANAEAALKTAKEVLRGLEETVAPETLKDLEMEDGFIFPDGYKFKPQQRVHVSIKKENHTAAMAWLKTNGAGSLIRTILTVDCGKGGHAEAAALLEYLRELFPQYEIEVWTPDMPAPLADSIQTFVKAGFGSASVEVEETTNAASLKAFVTKLIRKGETLPECFGIYAPKIVSLDRPRAKGEQESPDF